MTIFIDFHTCKYLLENHYIVHDVVLTIDRIKYVKNVIYIINKFHKNCIFIYTLNNNSFSFYFFLF